MGKPVAPGLTIENSRTLTKRYLRLRGMYEGEVFLWSRVVAWARRRRE